MTIKAIIFDLGGVILDLRFSRMVEQFESLGIQDFAQYFNLKNQDSLFQKQELGLNSDAQFFADFRQLTQSELTDQQIESTWNLILGDFDKARMDLLTELSADYSLYLFSNTNSLHARCFEKRCLEQIGRSLDSYFEKAYYSHELHLRKPTVESFEEILQQSKLQAAQTLFVDDNADNIAGAKTAGLQTYHLQAPESLIDLDFQKITQ